MPPAVLGAAKLVWTMSSKPLDSRGWSVMFSGAAPAVQGLGMKQWYVAVTFRLAVYDVLNTRTSEKNGACPTIDAAAGNVTVSAKIQPAAPSCTTAAHKERQTLRD